MIKFLKEEFKEFTLLLKEIPSLLLVTFILAIVLMNLLANKSIDLNTPYVALDCGIFVSWITFIIMDILVQHFGPKAATEVSILSIISSLIISLIFYLISIIPGTWSQAYVPGSEETINSALNGTFASSWFVILGSTAAFIVSSLVNNFSNYAIGFAFKKKPDSKIAYFSRSYISTAIGQFVDNFVFAYLVSHFFFGWNMIQCVTCSLIGMGIELLLEVIFSYVGYKITERWRNKNIGISYFEYKNNLKLERLKENWYDRKREDA